MGRTHTGLAPTTEKTTVMKSETAMSLVAIAMSTVAIVVSGITAARDPLGTDLSKYDLSSPENTLRSIHAMAERRDLKAGWELAKTLIQTDAPPETKLFLGEDVKLRVVKSVEVAGSVNPSNNGTIVSFVTFTVSGVDYYTVQFFKRESGKFYLGGSFSIPYGTEPNEADKALQASIAQFKATGVI